EGTFSERQSRYKADPPGGKASHRGAARSFPRCHRRLAESGPMEAEHRCSHPEELRNTLRFGVSQPRWRRGDAGRWVSVRGTTKGEGTVENQPGSYRQFQAGSPQNFRAASINIEDRITPLKCDRLR